MLLLYTMGCGRSRAASSTTSKDVENSEQKKSSLQQNNKSATEKQDKDSKKESFDQKKRKISAQLKNAEKKQSNENKYTENSPPAKIPSNTVNGSMVHENTEEQDRGDNTEHTGLSPTKTIREKPPPPPSMMLQTKMSNSQLEFFKMLDEKIEKGRDYSSEDERPYSIACK